MKKLLLSISLCISIAFFACKPDDKAETQTTTSGDTTTQVITTVTVTDSSHPTGDTNSAAKARNMNSTNEKVVITTPPDGKGTKGEGTKTGDGKTVGNTPGKDKTTVPVNPPTRIDHKADEQAKIDSIKKAKSKGKK